MTSLVKVVGVRRPARGLLVVLLLLAGAGGGHPSPRRMGALPPHSLSCPPRTPLLPCVCHLRGPQIHVMCESSEQVKVSEALGVLTRHAQPVEELHLMGNRIPVLPGRTFGSLMIHKVFLMDNEMVAVTRNAFAGLESSLQHLHVSEPALQDLPFDTLDHLANLRTFVLENTRVTNIPRMNSLSKLEFLKIDGSRVDTIPSAAFRFMPNMKKVHIANSNLRQLDTNALEGLVYLKELNFSHNAIERVHPRAFRTLTSVQHLDLSGNQVSDAAMAVLATRELRGMKVLDLSHNRMKRLMKGTFVDMPTLTTLDLSYNAIARVEPGAFFKLPAMTKLDLSGNQLGEFSNAVFPEPLGLHHLALAANNLTRVTELRYLARVLPRLRSLDLSHNHLLLEQRGILAGHAALEALRLDHNHIKRLNEGMFRELPNLRELYLSHNQIRGDELQGSAWDLPLLHLLDLSHNDLVKVDADLLAGMSRLDTLDLSFNRISSVTQDALAMTPGLTHLNLSYNSLATLPEGVFADLTNLMVLELSYNELLALDGGLLRGLDTLESLYLGHNQIMSLAGDAFANTTSLSYLDLSANLLQDVSTGALAHLSALKVLKLRRNAIGSLQQHYLRGLHTVEHLDLSNNHLQELNPAALQDLGGLRDLDLSVNYLQNLHPDLFLGSPAVERVNASHNYLTDLGGRSLGAVPGLRVLDLTNNSLTALGESVRDLPDLQGLFLADNYLTALTNRTFSGLPSLTILRLNNNGVQTFEAGTFHNLPDLLTLDLSNNNLVELNPDSFRSLQALEEVRLANNQIAIVKDFAFSNLSNLLTLEMQDNVITEIGAHSFHTLPVLRFLNLSHNELPVVPEDALTRLPALHVLDLSGNYILSIMDSSFHRLLWLNALMLNDNALCHLSSGAFEKQRSLRVLTLHNNQLRRLHLHALGHALASLSLLDMSGNPFQCDCELVWLREQLQSAPDDHRGGRGPLLGEALRGVPVCAAPSRYQGRPITQVPASAFLCEGEEGKGGRRKEEAEREACEASRFLDPFNDAGDHSNALLTNLTQGSAQPSYLDYTNPILVDAPPPLPASATTPTPAAVVVSSATVSFKPPKKQQAGQHTVTGDTPTIYAGSNAGGGDAAAAPQDSGQPGFLGGLPLPSLPSLPALMESVFNLANLGLNVHLGGLPGLGRQDGGAISKVGALDDHKPMKGPDQQQPIWVEGPSEPHPLFTAPPPPPSQTQPKPQTQPKSPDTETMPVQHHNHGSPSRGPGAVVEDSFVFPMRDGHKSRPGVPGVVVPVARPTNIWGTRPRPKGSTRPVLPPVMHSGPGPSSGTPFLPGLPAGQQGAPATPGPIILDQPRDPHPGLLPQILPLEHPHQQSPQQDQLLVIPQHETGVGGLEHGGVRGGLVPSSVGLPQWSHPENIHPDSGVSLYQPGEPFLPYQPHDPFHPITVVDAPQDLAGSRHPSTGTHEDLSSSESQVVPLPDHSSHPQLVPHHPHTPSPTLTSTGSPPSTSPAVGVTWPPVLGVGASSSVTHTGVEGSATPVVPLATPHPHLLPTPTAVHLITSSPSPAPQEESLAYLPDLLNPAPPPPSPSSTPMVSGPSSPHTSAPQLDIPHSTQLHHHHHHTVQPENHHQTIQPENYHHQTPHPDDHNDHLHDHQSPQTDDDDNYNPTTQTDDQQSKETEDHVSTDQYDHYDNTQPEDYFSTHDDHAESHDQHSHSIHTDDHYSTQHDHDHHDDDHSTQPASYPPQDLPTLNPQDANDSQPVDDNNPYSAQSPESSTPSNPHLRDTTSHTPVVGTTETHPTELHPIEAHHAETHHTEPDPTEPVHKEIQPMESQHKEPHHKDSHDTEPQHTQTHSTETHHTIGPHLAKTNHSEPQHTHPNPILLHEHKELAVPRAPHHTQTSSTQPTPSRRPNPDLPPAIFPPRLGEGVSIVKDVSATTATTTTITTTTTTVKGPSEDSELPRFHSGVVKAVGRPGEVQREGLTYVSPSRSVGGGVPTIERVPQPGQTPLEVRDEENEEVRVGQDGTFRNPSDSPRPSPDTQHHANDWYFTDYHRELTSLPAGGNTPPSAARALTAHALTLVLALLCALW